MGISFSSCCTTEENLLPSAVGAVGTVGSVGSVTDTVPVAVASNTKKISATTVYEINTILKSLSDDVSFQQNMKRPLVKDALDHWEGTKQSASGGNNTIKADIEAFQEKLRHLEEICNKCGVRVPLDHVRAGKRNLDDNHLPSLR